MRYPPFSKPTAPEAEIPSISNFLDELPGIDDFLSDERVDNEYEELPFIEEFAPTRAEEPGWAAADWQSFDWTRAAALGKRSHEDSAADADWGTTEWNEREANERLPGGSQPPQYSDPTAQEVAMALDDIARRIRSGELSIDQFQGTPPEAGMAAALAALLRMRG